MSDSKKEAAAGKQPQEFLRPEVGMPVYWFPFGDSNQEPQAAIITKVGINSVNLSIFSPDLKDLIVRDGVRHMSDKATKTPEWLEQGGWDYQPWMKRLASLLE